MIKKNTAYITFRVFQAIKLHLTTMHFDFNKTIGMATVKPETFILRNDQVYFHRLASKYSITEVRDFILANLLVDTSLWIGDLASYIGEDNYRRWLKTKQSLTYVFENDIIDLINSVDNPNDMLVVHEGRFPILLVEAMGSRIALETMVILQYFMNFFPMWNNKIDDDIIWPQYYMKCTKYLPLMRFDEIKCRQILLKHMRA